ncbi:MAG: glycoside hydrolase, partial [Candidatus Azobacteroides sp.]|nr:glycoside hydrolase [Candidatus Azobacteroides sp.]
MKQLLLLIVAVGIIPCVLFAQTEENRIESDLPIRGLAIAAPSVNGVDLFLKFIEEELAPAHFNLLILRVDWNYAYETHPELRDD